MCLKSRCVSDKKYSINLTYTIQTNELYFESFEICTMQPQNIIEYYFVQHRNIVKKDIRPT